MRMQLTKVLIVDDHALFRQGVRNIIEPEEDFEVVGEAEDGTEALAKARELKPDLILMDIYMPRGDGLEAVSAIKKELTDVRIVMLTIHDDKDENLLEAIKRGAEGFLSKSMRAKDLLSSLRGVMRGEAAIPRRMTGKILEEFARLAEMEEEKNAGKLTPREIELLQQISQGLTNKEIALVLRISENTVKAHVTNILRKLNLQSRSEAAAYARQLDLHESLCLQPKGSPFP
jgi:DNA-binding NarL/FixJ family response regulator